MQLTQWSKELLEMLAWKLRVASATQLSRASDTRREVVIRRLLSLKRLRLVEYTQTPIHDWNSLVRLLVWPSDNWATEMRRLPWRLEQRWDSLHCSCDTVAWIAPHGVKIFGGFGGRLRQRLQLQHDLGVAATYFSFSGKRRRRWMGEDHFRTAPESRLLKRIPDAVLKWPERVTAIEFGGVYDKNKLMRFHREMKRRRVRYEIY